MKELYVVRQSFKCHRALYEVGTVIDDPSSVTLLRSRLGDRTILILREGDATNINWYSYLSSRVKKPIDDYRILEICEIPVDQWPETAKAKKNSSLQVKTKPIEEPVVIEPIAKPVKPVVNPKPVATKVVKTTVKKA